ncbi:hypothetical protein R6Z07F_013073 [Ovis aries]
MATLLWELPELTGVSDCWVLVGSGCGGRAQSYSRDPAPGRGVRCPTRGGAGSDRRGASPLPFGVLLGVALRLGALTSSLRAGGGALLTPSPGARLGGRWVWGGSGAGDGGGRCCGGSGTSGRSPGSAVRWAGSQASGEDTASYYNFSEAPLEAQQMWAPQPTAQRGAGEPQRSPF